MKIVVGRHLRNKRKFKIMGMPYINKTNYIFLCPFDNIQVGDYAVVDNNKGDYSIIEIIAEDYISSAGKALNYDPVPYRHVLFKVPIKDYKEYREMVASKERSMLGHYKHILEREQEKGKVKKRRTIDEILKKPILPPDNSC